MRFNVKLAPIHLFDGTIATDEKSIEADYFRIEQGAMIFRNNAAPGRNSYPEPVHIFAPGVWAEVEVERAS